MTTRVETSRTIELTAIDADVEIDNVRIKSIILHPAVAGDSVIIVDKLETPTKLPVKFPITSGSGYPQIVYVEQRLSLLIDYSESTLNAATKVIINKGA